MDDAKTRERLTAFADTLQLRPSQTIRPGQREDATMDDLLVPGAAGRFAILAPIGSGGMGVVHRARQLSMDREVAIKEPKPDLRGDRDIALSLVQEAWVTGSLEHPNIVPIHDIDLQDPDAPRVVMKRIQGWSWGELITDADRVRDEFGESDLLEWNLQILLRVTDAVRYAHAQGIVHLDLKPSNVMVGAFGEVYVVDWGIAMGLGDAAPRLPRATDNLDILGTPAYLAPEMLAQDGSDLSERTDVYLLGGLLHHILTGAPPHQGGSTVAVLYDAAFGTRDLPEELPEEVRAICLRALAQDPSERFATASAFQLAVRDFIQHRGARRLIDEASRQLVALRAATKAPRDDVRAHWDEVNRALSEARFGFRQALAAWPESTEAREGLRETLIVIVEHVLAHGTATTASALFSSIEDPPDGLEERVRAALAAHAAEEERVRGLEQVAQDLDVNLGRGTRLLFLGLLGLLWVVHPLVGIDMDGERGLRQLIGPPAGFLILAVALGWVARGTLRKTQVNRRLFTLVVTMFAAQVALVGMNWSLGITEVAHAPSVFFLWALIAFLATVLADRRLWPTALGQALGLAVTLAVPAWFPWAIAGANALFLVNILAIWRPGRD